MNRKRGYVKRERREKRKKARLHRHGPGWMKANKTAGFYIPRYSVAIAVGSVFAVVFAAMPYSPRKLRQGDLVKH